MACQQAVHGVHWVLMGRRREARSHGTIGIPGWVPASGELVSQLSSAAFHIPEGASTSLKYRANLSIQVITSLPALLETSTCPAGAWAVLPVHCFLCVDLFPFLTLGFLELKVVSYL